MNRPIIGVSSRKIYYTHNDRPYPRFGVSMHYVQAVEAAGGAPIMLPLSQSADVLKQLLSICDGLLLTGGFDIDPSWYGEEPHKRIAQINPLRDITEMILTKEALERDMPVFGICRGMQVLNVAMGGTLQQDIGTEAHWFAHHEVELAPGSRMAKALGSHTVAAGHCVHHQALDVVAPGLDIVGRTADGLVHAAEVDGAAWVVATQWHPEDTAHSDAQQQALFTALIDHV